MLQKETQGIDLDNKQLGKLISGFGERYFFISELKEQFGLLIQQVPAIVAARRQGATNTMGGPERRHQQKQTSVFTNVSANRFETAQFAHLFFLHECI